MQHLVLKTFSDSLKFDLINSIFLTTDNANSIYEVPDATGTQEEERAVQGTDQENAVHGPITDKKWSSKGNEFGTE